MLLTKPLKGIPGWTFEKRSHETFDFLPDPHEYRLQERRLWSPSGTFLQVGYVNSKYYTQEACYRGQFVHRATHLYDTGQLDWKQIPAEYLGYVEAYCEAKEIWRIKPRMREVPIYHRECHYGVTPDGECIILDGDPAIVELKSGSMPWWTAIQTAAQDLAVASWDAQETFRRRIGIELRKNGRFSVKEFTDDHDYDVWRGNLTTVQRLGQPQPKLTEALAY